MKWISVKDQLPGHKDKVLGFIPDDYGGLFAIVYRDRETLEGEWWTHESNPVSFNDIETVSHWMPLPPKPEKPT